MKTLFSSLVGIWLALSAAIAGAAGGGYPLDPYDTQRLTNQSALQNGAKIFVNYCLNCHSANMMRYNRLSDIGLTPEQIKQNLLFTADKIGDPMRTSLSAKDAKEWFGAQPPDLSLIARARSSGDGSGSSWLYTYLRSYYRDNTRATGWNNAVFPNVGMPHVLWDMQGPRGATIEDVKTEKNEKGVVTGYKAVTVKFDALGNRTESTAKLQGLTHHESSKTTLDKAAGGSLNQAEYDGAIADLVAYLTYMSDPSAATRTNIGIWVLLALGIFTIFAWRLNSSYWKHVK
jgi:ubiquinol-cytochrome c reductase cytochrome c1 subunit